MVNHFRVIATTFALASIGAGAVFGLTKTAVAQRVVTCESDNNKTTTCPINTQGGVRLVRQLSRATCNGNWGSRNNRVWVRNGCRAEFVSGRRLR